MGVVVLDKDVFWQPPLVPGMARPYYGVRWADVGDSSLSVDVHRIQYRANDAIVVLRTCLPEFGLGHLLTGQQSFLRYVWLFSPDTPGSPDPVHASNITDPAEFARYKLAVFYSEETIVWVHRVDSE